MKKIILLLFTIVLACNLQAQHNSWQEALPINNGVWSNSDSLYFHGDLYYRFEVSGESYLEISMIANNLSGFIDIAFYCLNPDNTLKQIWMSGGSSSSRIFKENAGDTLHYHFTNFSDGTYFINAYGGNSPARIRVKYDWNKDFFPNDQEPNDQLANAVPIQLNKLNQGHLGFERTDGTKDKVDWYQVTVPEDGMLRFYLDRIKSPYENYYNRTTIENDFYFLTDTGFIENPVYEGIRSDWDINNDSLDYYYLQHVSKGTYAFPISLSNGYNYGFYQFRVEFEPLTVTNDAENNDTWTKAKLIAFDETVTGRVGYIHPDGSIDKKDWYKFDIPGDGMISVIVERTINPGETSYSGFEISDFSFLIDTSIIDYPNTYGSMFSDWNKETDSTYYYYHNQMSKGTALFSLQCRYGYKYGSYRFKIHFEPSPIANDEEPNDDIHQANVIEFEKTYTGHLCFAHPDGTKDSQDWYSFTMPEDGRIHVEVNRYNSYNQKENFYMEFSSLYTDSTLENYNTLKFDNKNSNDSIHHYYLNKFAKGTYYFYTTNRYGSSYGDYGFTFYYDTCDVIDDVEPNDEWTQAIEIHEGDTMSGHLGYIDIKKHEDNHDWYKINTPSNGSIHLYFKVLPQGETGYSVDDWCRIYPDLYYNDDSVITNISRFKGEYAERTGVDTFAHLTLTTLGKNTYYLDLRRDGGYGWYQFYYETRPAPTADFDFIQQTQDNGDINVCFFNKSSEDATAFDWDFGTGYYRNSNLVNPTYTYTEPGVFPVRLIAKNAEGNDTIIKEIEIYGLQRVENNRAGQGDVTLKFYAGGIKDNDKYFLVKDSIEYEGAVLRRVSNGCTEVRFHMAQASLGNYDAIIRHSNGKEMSLKKAFTLEKVIEPEIYVDLIGRDKMLYGRWQSWEAIIGNAGNVDAYNQTLYIVTPNDSAVPVRLTNVTFIHAEGDSLAWLDEIPPYLVYDSVEMGGRPVRVYPLMFSVIPAGTEVSVNLRMHSMKDEQLEVFTTNPFSNESKQKDYDSYEDCVAWSVGKFVAEKAAGFLLDQIPGASCVKDVIKFTYQTTESTCDKSITAGSLAWGVATTAWSCAKEFCGPLKAYKMTCDLVDFVIDIADNYDADKECQKYKNKNRKKKNIRAVSSFDPNEMIGPLGVGEYNDTRLQDFTYRILFENKATASAAAQEVVITDTLDRSKFDLNSIQFNAFGFSDSTYYVNQAGLGFVTELNWDSVLVRVSGKLDTLTGVVTWQFITLDPKTMALTENPNAGFLPANVNPGEGEGFVSFTIALNKKVKDGDIIDNEATILFDANEPIKTNLYSNRIDENKPTSRISRVEKVEGVNNSYTIYFDGHDSGCGINFYRLSVMEKGTDTIITAGHITEDFYTMTLNPEKEYYLYLQAVDKLYIEETEKDGPDYIFNGSGIRDNDNEDSEQALAMGIQPNPAQGNTTIAFRNTYHGQVTLGVYNVIGVKLFEENLCMNNQGIHYHQINVSDLPKGMYIVRLQCGNRVTQQKLMVQ